MCNSEILDAVREEIGKLITRTGELRNRFNEVEEDFREGNLDQATLGELNQAVHKIESNAAAFEALLEVEE